MNTVEVLTDDIDEPPWRPKLEAFANRVLEELALEDWDLSVLLCSNRVIRDLNKRYRGKDEATDVLSFAQVDPSENSVNPVFNGVDPAIMSSFALGPDGYEEPDEEEPDIPARQTAAGDIVISLDAVAENSAYFDVPQSEELQRLVVHGILHLAGYEHDSNDPDQEMLVMQEEILSKTMEDELF